jgi:hypothetical protein
MEGDKCIGGWVGPRAGLDDVEKVLDPTGTRTPTPRSSTYQAVTIPTALSRLRMEGDTGMKGIEEKKLGDEE